MISTLLVAPRESGTVYLTSASWSTPVANSSNAPHAAGLTPKTLLLNGFSTSVHATINGVRYVRRGGHYSIYARALGANLLRRAMRAKNKAPIRCAHWAPTGCCTRTSRI